MGLCTRRSATVSPPPKRILDVAGDISLFGCFIARSLDCRVDIVDMGDLQYCNDIRTQLPQAFADRICLKPHTKIEEFASYDAYDFIYCISAIEHFDADADLTLMALLKGLLNTGGTAVITAPFTPKPETEKKYRAANYYRAHSQQQQDDQFYMKYYSVENIRRLAQASGLNVVSLGFAGEIVNFCDRIFLHEPDPNRGRIRRRWSSLVYRLVGALSPIYPFIFMRGSSRPDAFKCGSRRKKICNPDTFVLVLQSDSG